MRVVDLDHVEAGLDGAAGGGGELGDDGLDAVEGELVRDGVDPGLEGDGGGGDDGVWPAALLLGGDSVRVQPRCYSGGLAASMGNLRKGK